MNAHKAEGTAAPFAQLFVSPFAGTYRRAMFCFQRLNPIAVIARLDRAIQ
jgi:hypothetical protein